MIRNDTILNNSYRIIREIGQGGTGVIYLAYHLNLNKYVIVKKIKDNFAGQINSRAEVDILKNLHHQFLPQVYNFIQVGNDIYTVMDYIEGHDLQYYLDRGYTFPEDTLKKWLQQLASVLNYLHSRVPPVLHSDIKPGNIMVTPNWDVVLIDFNISIDGENSKDIQGMSPWYAAPEQVRKANAILSGVFDPTVLDGRMDIYSLGAVFFHLMTGQKPETNRDQSQILEYMELPYTPGLVSIVKRMVQPLPDKRFSTAAQLEKALDNVTRYDPVYRRFSLLQGGTAFAWALCVIAGALCIYYGSWRSLVDHWRTSYQSIYTAAAQEDSVTVIAEGTSLLNSAEFRSYLKKNPEKKAKVLDFVGESLYRQKQFADAAQYYKEAWEENSRESSYYENYIAALIRGNQLGEAGALVDSDAGRRYLSEDKRNLMLLEIAWQSGQRDMDPMEMADLAATLASRGELEAASNAYLILGENLLSRQEYETAVTVLDRAVQLVPDRDVRRQLGEAASKASVNSSQSTVENSYLQKAYDSYKILAESQQATYEDRLNYALTVRARGEYETSNWTLKELVTDYPDYYQPSMWMCYNYLDIVKQKNNLNELSTDLTYHYRNAKHIYQEQAAYDDDMLRLIEAMKQLHLDT